MNNAVFELTAEGGARYALRVHRPGFRTDAQTRSELLFLRDLWEDLQGTQVIVPQPVAARDGEFLVVVDGRHCDLLTWVDGRVMRPGRGLGPAGLNLLGEALGRIHDFGRRWERPTGLELPRWDHDALFTEASPYRPRPIDQFMSAEDLDFFREVAEKTREVFETLDVYAGSLGIIHADFILLNCRLARRSQGWRAGIIDFDDLGWGYLLYDLAPFLGNLADYPGYPAMRDAFLGGYRSIRELPAELDVHLPVLMAARHAAACLWAAGIDRSGGAGVPVREHLAIRMDLARECLALATRRASL